MVRPADGRGQLGGSPVHVARETGRPADHHVGGRGPVLQAAESDGRPGTQRGQHGGGRTVCARAADRHHRLPRQQAASRAGDRAVLAAQSSVSRVQGPSSFFPSPLETPPLLLPIRTSLASSCLFVRFILRNLSVSISVCLSVCLSP